MVIEVSDVNDNAPEFQEAPYVAEVSEVHGRPFTIMVSWGEK